jgi:hypothetical protein
MHITTVPRHDHEIKDEIYRIIKLREEFDDLSIDVQVYSGVVKISAGTQTSYVINELYSVIKLVPGVVDLQSGRPESNQYQLSDKALAEARETDQS